MERLNLREIQADLSELGTLDDYEQKLRSYPGWRLVGPPVPVRGAPGPWLEGEMPPVGTADMYRFHIVMTWGEPARTEPPYEPKYRVDFVRNESGKYALSPPISRWPY